MNRKQTILFYDNIALPDRQRGVYRYFSNIVRGFEESADVNVIVCTSAAHRYPNSQTVPMIAPGFRGSARLGLSWYLEQIRNRQLLRHAQDTNAAVIFTPYYSLFASSIPVVSVLHDMTHELLKEYFPDSNRFVAKFLKLKEEAMTNANRVITVSNNTASDLHRIYPHVTDEKVSTVYHGVDELFFDIGSPANAERPYFLYVGLRAGYKNFLQLLNAYAQSGLATDYDLRVISPIGKSFTRDELQLIHEYELEHSVLLEVDVSDEQLAERYQAAVALVFPSLYEGFGLPLLEALAAGTLVVCSNVSSMPEVVGDHALYFESGNIESLCDALHSASALTSTERQRLINAGIAHARTFTWDRCIEETLKIVLAAVE